MPTKHSISRYKTRLLPLAGALFITLATAQGQAQSSNETSQLLNRIKQLENQMNTMSRAVYKGDMSAMPPVSSSGAPDTAMLATVEVRMSAIEDKQRTLTGQLEKVTFDLQQLKSRLERMQADTEQRFQQGAASTGGSVSGSGGEQPTALSTTQNPPLHHLGTLSSKDGNGPAEGLYEEAFSYIREAKYAEAEKGFKLFLKDYPGHPLASNAQYWLGETYYVRGEFQQGAKIFAQNYQNFPNGPKAADSLLKLGLSLSKLGKKDDACLSLRQLQKEVSDEANPLRRKATQEIKALGCS